MSNDRLARRVIAICENVDARAVAFDGPVGTFNEAATAKETNELARLAYRLARGCVHRKARARKGRR